MRLQQHQPERARVVLLDEVEQVLEVAERLGHLLARAVDDEGVVHPVLGEALAEGDGLGPLVLVVRELQVEPAAVQVEALAEQAEAHHDALAVPARPPVAPRRRPRRLARLGQLPQGEVGRVALALGADDLALAAAGEHVVEVLLGEQAVVLDGSHREVHAVVGAVGAADLEQLADHLDHLVDPLGGVGDVGRALEADAVHGVPPHRLAARWRPRPGHGPRARPAR